MKRTGSPASFSASLIERPRLLRLLTEAGFGTVALTAPAGWGKTTLLSAWSAAQKGRVAWLTLEHEHTDEERLVRALAATLETLFDGQVDAAGIADCGQPAVERARLLARASVAAAAAGWVLDDAHIVGQRTPAAAVLDAFARALVPATSLRVGSRTRPSFVDARTLVHDDALELTPETLALDRSEIRRVFTGLECAGDDSFVARVAAATEGWPAGVRALRLLADRLGDAERALETLRRDGNGLSEYFAREVLAHLRPAERRTLLDSAPLDAITSAGCRSVVRDPNAWRRLLRLARTGTFVSMDAAGRELRVHALLRDELRRRLRARSPVREARLHLRAARWHMKAGRLEPAVDHALDAFDATSAGTGDASRFAAERAATLLEASAASVLMRAGRGWFLERAGRIPAMTLARRPYLARLILWLDRDGQSSAQPLPPITDDSPNAQHARCMDAALRVNVGLRSSDASRLAADALDARATMPPDDPFLQSVVVSLLQVAYRFGGDPSVARAAVAETSALASRPSRPMEAVQARAMLGVLHMMQGRLHAAEEALRHGLALAGSALGADAVQTAMCHQFLGYVAYTWNALDDAVSHLERAVAIAMPHQHDGILTGALRVLAVTRLRTGDEAGARAAMADLERLVNTPSASPRNREWMDGVRSAFTLASGSTDGIAAWIARWRYDARDLANQPLGQLHARFQELFVLAEGLIALGRSREAIPLVRSLGTAAAAAERTSFRVVALMLEAAALESIGETAVAESALHSAIREAGPENMVRTIADGPRVIATVLARLQPDAAEAAFVLRIGSAFGEAVVAGDALTSREREVLALLSRGLSNKAMARALGVSLATIKTHLNHLYGKLDASNRTHAVARARERGYVNDNGASKPGE